MRKGFFARWFSNRFSPVFGQWPYYLPDFIKRRADIISDVGASFVECNNYLCNMVNSHRWLFAGGTTVRKAGGRQNKPGSRRSPPGVVSSGRGCPPAELTPKARTHTPIRLALAGIMIRPGVNRKETNTMRRFFPCTFAAGLLFGAGLLALSSRPLAAADDDVRVPPGGQEFGRRPRQGRRESGRPSSGRSLPVGRGERQNPYEGASPRGPGPVRRRQ